MGKSFKKIKASFIGSHKDNKKIPQWLEANGGAYSSKVDDSVTHLIATESAVKENHEAVEKARSLKIKIVTYDWLEDSLLSKGHRPKGEGPYLWDRILKEHKTTKVVKKQGNKKTYVKRLAKPKYEVDWKSILGEHSQDAQIVDSGVERCRLCYIDEAAGESYAANLKRVFHRPYLSIEESFYIGVYESNDMPHTYTIFVKYAYQDFAARRRYLVRPEKGGFNAILASKGSLDAILLAFRDFFYTRTGLKWEDRHKRPLNPYDRLGNGPGCDGWFTFRAPSGTKAGLKIDSKAALILKATGAGGVAENEAMEDAPASGEDA